MMNQAKKLLYLILIAMHQRVSLSDETNLQAAQDAPEAFCQFESFHPRCLKNEIVLIKSATYGRMRIGKCVKTEEIETLGEDPRYLGCSADVSTVLDRKCSGKTECEVRVYDISDENIQPCFSGLKMYLEVSYSCIAVADEKRSCVVAASRSPTHIIGSSDSQRICGTRSQPWMIEAPFGQKLNIRQLSFTIIADSDHGPMQTCYKYGVIVDRIGKKNASICGGGSQRERDLYLSTGNTVEIYFDTVNQPENIGSARQFTGILRIESVGCSDIIPPEDSWLKRNGDEVVIGCYAGRQTWQMRCERGKWIGVLGNCSQGRMLSEFFIESEATPTLSGNAQVMAIIAICGFTLAICITIMCVGAICLRRYHIQSKRKQDYKTLKNQTNSARSQPLPSDAMTYFPRTGLATQQQLPSCSVYSGQNDFSDVDNSVGLHNAEPSARL